MSRDRQDHSPAPAPGSAGQREPLPELGGHLVEGSEVFLPRSGRAGDVIQGRAPAGSTVEFQGRRMTVAPDGVYELRLPDDAEGALPVRIERPDGRPTVLRLRIEPR